MRQFAIVVLVLTAGLAGLAVLTDGFRAYTAEGARRLSVQEAPRSIPDVLLEDAQGRRFMLHSTAQSRLVVDFFYAGCETVCTTLAGSFARLQRRLLENGDTNTHLLSISFDPRDRGARLSAYAEMKKADPDTWTFARVVNPADLQPLLDAFGITVLPSPLVGYEHNAALHLVDGAHRLAFVTDYDDPDAMAARLGLSP